ncbi:hypothetical protein JCM18899A_43150 [Nocardioides sp. AN3]
MHDVTDEQPSVVIEPERDRIDLGPGGGDAGGRVVATGTPTDMSKAGDSATAPYLARRLERT